MCDSLQTFEKNHGILYMMKSKRPIKQPLLSPVLLSSLGRPGTKTKRLLFDLGME